jgi:hypothetical protein
MPRSGCRLEHASILPAATAWSGDASRNRVSQPDRPHCTIRLVDSLLRTPPADQLLVLVQVDLHEEGRDASRDQTKTDFTVWQFRLSKAGRTLCALEISRAPLASARTQRKKSLARRRPGEARPQVRGERRWRGSWIPHGNHRPSTRRSYFSRMLLREPRASLADPAGGDCCHRPMPD